MFGEISQKLVVCKSVLQVYAKLSALKDTFVQNCEKDKKKHTFLAFLSLETGHSSPLLLYF